MSTQTAYKIEQTADAGHNGYLAALDSKGVLDGFEQQCNELDAGGALVTVDVADFVAAAREAMQNK